MTPFLVLLLLLPRETPTTSSALEVPFDILASRHMAVEIRVNGKGPFRVIFDTGAPVNLVSSKLAREADLFKQQKKAAAPPMPAMFNMGGMVRLDELTIGAVTAKKQPVIVMDHPTVKALGNMVGGLEGIIGFPFFARYRTTVDYQQRKMFMEPVDYDPGDVMAAMMKVMLASKNKPPVKELGARTVWGLSVSKPEGDESPGVLVTRVWDGGPAAEAGLLPGDRLLIFDASWTESPEDCYRAAAGVRAGQPVRLKILREGKEFQLSVTPRPGV